MEALLQDLKFAFRSLAKSPGFTLVAVLTLALGIGANTAIFGILHSVLLEPLPYAHPDRLVAAWETQGKSVMGLSALDLQDWQRQTSTLAHLAGYGAWEQNVAGGNEPARVSTAEVTPEFFEVFGVAPLVGRVFDTRDRALGAVISEKLWKRLFGGDPSVLSRSLHAEGVTVPVVGVLPARFDFPHETDIWIPVDLAADHTSRSAHNYALVGSLTPTASLAAARIELQGIAARLANEYPNTNLGVGAKVMGLQESLVGSVRPTLILLAVMVGIVLLIATANVAGLLMARATERRRELAMRAALGAGVWRLVRQLLVEGVVLSGVGAVGGVLVAQWTVAALRLNPAVAALPATPGVLQLPVLGFTTALACTAALLFSAAPAAAAWRIDLAETLKQTGGRGATALRLRGALIGVEVALAVLCRTHGAQPVAPRGGAAGIRSRSHRRGGRHLPAGRHGRRLARCLRSAAGGGAQHAGNRGGGHRPRRAVHGQRPRWRFPDRGPRRRRRRQVAARRVARGIGRHDRRAQHPVVKRSRLPAIRPRRPRCRARLRNARPDLLARLESAGRAHRGPGLRRRNLPGVQERAE